VTDPPNPAFWASRCKATTRNWKTILKLFDDYLDKEPVELKIPISVLSTRKLSCLEAAVKFLREEAGLSNADTAKVLGRSLQVCWTTYKNATGKMPEAFSFSISDDDVPADVFRDKKLSVLESIVAFLVKKGRSFHEIAVALSRDDRTIWTIHSRAAKKNGK